jgi:hypothetical protein
MHSLQVLKSLELSKNGVILHSSLNTPTLSNQLAGHRKKGQKFSYLFAIPLVAILLAAACIPLGNQPLPVARVASKPKDKCEANLLNDWLLGKVGLDYVKMGKASSLGGVTSGVLTCNGSRYSYALGTIGTKRVLNLLKLNA